MPIVYEKIITRGMLRASPQALFVFGDNLQRKGLGGQAAEMRGEPNAVGIATKIEPTMHPGAFFADGDLDTYRRATSLEFARLQDHLKAGGTVVLPADGLGTGRARLRQTAPKVWAQLQEDFQALREAAVSPPETPDPAGRAALAREEG